MSHNTMIKASLGTCAVKIETIYTPGFVILRYVCENTLDEVILGDIGKHQIVLPICMLREHDKSNTTRTTSARYVTEVENPSKPAYAKLSSKQRVLSSCFQRPMAENFELTETKSRRPIDKNIIETIDNNFDNEVLNLERTMKTGLV